MDNKVGTVVPTAEEFEQMVRDAHSLKERVKKFGLTLEDRQLGANMRVGGERYVPVILELAQEYGVRIAGMPLEGMQADFRLFQETPALERSVAELHQMVSDTRLQAGSECWQAVLGYYGALSAMASRDPELAKRLEPMTEFMAKGARARKPK